MAQPTGTANTWDEPEEPVVEQTPVVAEPAPVSKPAGGAAALLLQQSQVRNNMAASRYKKSKFSYSDDEESSDEDSDSDADIPPVKKQTPAPVKTSAPK